MKQGIDVSAHDGRIDWKKVKDSGVNFAILRAGYGNSITQKDEQFQRNYREATRVGIPVGAYWFSYATSVEDAKKEAKTCKEAIKGCRLSYPIFYDFEYDSVRYAAEQGVQVTKPLATAFAKAFLQEMERGGYYVGNYANVDYYQNYFDEKELKRYPLWLAEWDVEKPSIRAALWQYSERGKVDGIAGAVDKNRTNVDFPAIIRRKGKNGFPKETQKRTATVRRSATLWAEAHTGSKKIQQVKKGTVVTLLQDDQWGWSRVRFSGTEGWMQNECLKGSGLSAYPTGICKGSDVNVRKSPNLTGKVLTQLQKGERFTVISILPSQWLHIRKEQQEGYVYYDPSYLTIHLAK